MLMLIALRGSLESVTAGLEGLVMSCHATITL